MKKSLIALAALAAVTAASAQSSVTVSGALVLGVGTTEIGTASSGLQVVRSTGNLSFDGSEDLGGGLKAGFRVQSSLGSIATSDTTTSVAAVRSLLGDRGLNVTISGGFGTVLVGRGNTGIKGVMGVADVSSISLITGVSGSSSAATASTDGRYEMSAGDASAKIIYGDTWAPQVAYQSPTISGLTFAVGITPSQTVATGVGDNGDTKDAISYSANYSNGPLNVAANFTDSQTGTAPSKLTTVAANYDLGVAKIALTSQSIRLATGTSPGNGMLFTANVPMGANSIGFGYGRRVASDSSHASYAGDDVKQTFIGYRHNLSKRTHVQAIYNNIDRAGTTTDQKETHIVVGHSF